VERPKRLSVIQVRAESTLLRSPLRSLLDAETNFTSTDVFHPPTRKNLRVSITPEQLDCKVADFPPRPGKRPLVRNF